MAIVTTQALTGNASATTTSDVPSGSFNTTTLTVTSTTPAIAGGQIFIEQGVNSETAIILSVTNSTTFVVERLAATYTTGALVTFLGRTNSPDPKGTTIVRNASGFAVNGSLNKAEVFWNQLAYDVKDLNTQIADLSALDGYTVVSGSGVSSLPCPISTSKRVIDVIASVRVATDNQPVYLQLSSDGGGSYNTSNYGGASTGRDTGGTAAGSGTTSTSGITVCGFDASNGVGSDTAEFLDFHGKLYHRGSTDSKRPHFVGMEGHRNNGGVYRMNAVGGTFQGTLADMDYFRIIPGSGNITGWVAYKEIG